MEDSRKMVQLFWSDETDGHFDAIISRNLPDLVSEGIHPFIDGCLKKKNLNIEDVDEWAIHPGNFFAEINFDNSICINSLTLKL